MKTYKQFIIEKKSQNDDYNNEYEEMDKKVIDDVFEDIVENCTEYLNMLQLNGKVLWRGMDIDKDIDIIIPYKNRSPKDTPPIIQNILDDLFEKKFGIKPRSQGVFAFQSKSIYNQYGPEYMIFPFDGFKYVWSHDVIDLYIDLRNMFGNFGLSYLTEYDINDIDKLTTYYNIHKGQMLADNDITSFEMWKKNMTFYIIKEKMKNIVDKYQDNDLDYLLKKGVDDKEVCIVCDKYYAISYKYQDIVSEKIAEYIKNKK